MTTEKIRNSHIWSKPSGATVCPKYFKGVKNIDAGKMNDGRISVDFCGQQPVQYANTKLSYQTILIKQSSIQYGTEIGH